MSTWALAAILLMCASTGRSLQTAPSSGLHKITGTGTGLSPSLLGTGSHSVHYSNSTKSIGSTTSKASTKTGTRTFNTGTEASAISTSTTSRSTMQIHRSLYGTTVYSNTGFGSGTEAPHTHATSSKVSSSSASRTPYQNSTSASSRATLNIGTLITAALGSITRRPSLLTGTGVQQYTLGPSILATGNKSELVLESSTISAGGSAFVSGSVTISLGPSGIVNIDGKTTSLLAPTSLPRDVMPTTITTFPPDMSTQRLPSGSITGNMWLTTTHAGHKTTAAVVNGIIIWFPHAWHLHTHYIWIIGGVTFDFGFPELPCIKIPILNIPLTPGCVKKPSPPVSYGPTEAQGIREAGVWEA